MTLQEYLDQEVPQEEICKNADGSVNLLIDVLYRELDEITGRNWSKRNFQFQTYFTHDGDMGVAASLELVVTPVLISFEKKDASGDEKVYTNPTQRTFIGTTNFLVKNLLNDPEHFNHDWLSTAETFCTKRAFAQWGRRTGRYLNKPLDQHPNHNVPRGGTKTPLRTKPDLTTKKKYAEAAARNDTEEMQKLESIYEFPIIQS